MKSKMTPRCRRESRRSSPRSLNSGHGNVSRRTSRGVGIGGDVPEKRRYLFEIEELQTKRTSIVSATAVFALDKNNHWHVSQTDLARAGPREEPWVVEAGETARPSGPVPQSAPDLTDEQRELLAAIDCSCP